MNQSKLVDRWLAPEIVRLVSGVCLVTFLLVAIIMFVPNSRGNTAFDTTRGADYGEFYVVGMMLNEGQADRLYDLGYQDERLHQLLPSLATTEHLPFVYPPFLALLFRPLAYLPFVWSFATWVALVAATYSLAVALTLRSYGSFDSSMTRTAWLVALSFQPFAIECCLGGQISTLGCLVVAIALFLRRKGLDFSVGLALSLLLYKPTLLLLIIPMLCVGRCWRTLGGFATGALGLGGISWLVAGTSGCLDSLGLMIGYGRLGGSVGQGFKTIKYIDLTAMLTLLGFSRSIARLLAIGVGLPALLALMGSWARDRGRVGDLTWSATLCFTPILNLYAPVYDVVLIVPGLLLATDSLPRTESGNLPGKYRWLLALVYLSSLVSQPSAIKLGFQPLTVALATMGSYFWLLSMALSRKKDSPDHGA